MNAGSNNRFTVTLNMGAILWLALCAASSLAKSPKKSASPGEVTRSFFIAIVSGNIEGAKSTFDSSTKDGKLNAKIIGEFTEVIRSVRTLTKATQKKFGQEGVDALDDALGDERRLGSVDESKLDALLMRGLKTFFSERGDEAVVVYSGGRGTQRFPMLNTQRYVMLNNHNGKWYIKMSANDLQAVAIFAEGPPGRELAQRASSADAILRGSRSLKEFKEKLRAKGR